MPWLCFAKEALLSIDQPWALRMVLMGSPDGPQTSKSPHIGAHGWLLKLWSPFGGAALY